MSREDGSVPVTGFLSPTDIEDNYPTHKDKYGSGGYRTAATIAERDAIKDTLRTQGMQVFVVEDNSVYQLEDVTNNSTWVKLFTIVNGVPDFGGDGPDINLPPLEHNYIWQGDVNGNVAVSTSMIDLSIDMIDAENQLAQIYGAHVMLTSPSVAFPNGTVVNTSSTKRSYLYVQNGELSTSEKLSFSSLPVILDNHVMVGGGLLGITEKPYELNSIPTTGNIDFDSFRGVNSGIAVEGTDVPNWGQVQSAIGDIPSGEVLINGVVEGSGFADGTAITTSFVPEAFTAELAENDITTLQVTKDLDFNMFRITNINDANDPLQAVNKRTAQAMIDDRTNAVTGAVVGSSQGNNAIPTSFEPVTFKNQMGLNGLNTLAQATGNYNIGGFRITNNANAVDNTDLTTLGQVNSLIAGSSGGGTVTITGAVSGSGAVGTSIATIYNSATFSSQLGTHSSSRMLPPDTAWSLGGFKATNMANGTANTDGATVGQVNTLLSRSYAHVYAVQGSGSTYTTTITTADTYVLLNYVAFEGIGTNFTFSNNSTRCTFTTTGLATTFKTSGIISFKSNTTGIISFRAARSGSQSSNVVISSKNVTANMQETLPLGGAVNLSNGQYMELWVTHSVSGATVTVNSLDWVTDQH